jgi:3-hydroxyacyl-[acyl-carrier-protein] dehydratase
VNKGEDSLSFDIMGIQGCQRNRYPLLFIDQITSAIPGKSANGLKSFTYNEWFFPAHFDDEPNVPGFIQVECLVQTFLMSFLCIDEYRGMKTSFVSISDVKFKRKIIPGETLIIESTLDTFRRGIAIGHAESKVNGELACTGKFIIAIPDILNKYRPQNAV